MILHQGYFNQLDHNEKLVIKSSEVVQGIYWTKNEDFGSAVGFYSDPVTDHYWTLVNQVNLNRTTVKPITNKVEQFFGSLSKDFAFYLLPHDREQQVDVLLNELGYQKAFTDGWMRYREIATPDIAQSPKIRIELVNSEAENEAFIAVYTKVYEAGSDHVYAGFSSGGVYPAIYRNSWAADQLRKKYRRFVGYYEDQPACGGTLYYQPQGIAMLMDVGTDPRFEHKGMATALSQAMIRAATEVGCRDLLLMTEPNTVAWRLYQRLGFEPFLECWGMAKA